MLLVHFIILSPEALRKNDPHRSVGYHLTEFGEKPTEVLDQTSKLQRNIDKDE